MPALLFNPSLPGRAVQFLLFWALALLSRRNRRPLAVFAVAGGVVFFNLLFPYGEVLFSLGPFPVSSGALEAGLRRAVTMEGLFMLSQLSIRQDLRLPGRFGEVMSESFRVFSLLAARRPALEPRALIERRDRLRRELSAPPPPAPASGPAPPGKPAPRVPPLLLPAANAAIAWLPRHYYRH
jgi:heptaprenyl diphosphate synthase